MRFNFFNAHFFNRNQHPAGTQREVETRFQTNQPVNPAFNAIAPGRRHHGDSFNYTPYKNNGIPAAAQADVAAPAVINPDQPAQPVVAGASNGVNFGINGHPLNGGTYNESFAQQIAQIKSLGLTTYRINVSDTSPATMNNLSQLVSAAQQQGVQILPVIDIQPDQYSSEASAYQAAKSVVQTLSQNFGSSIPVWELGNEYDLYSLTPGANGASPSDYDTSKYDVTRGLLQGMLDGLHAGSPTAKSIIDMAQNNSNALDTGFLQRLLNDGVNFDITGYHYYSGDGSVPVAADGTNALQTLHDQFNKPIWVTEFDQWNTSDTVGPNADPQAQGKALATGMQDIASHAQQDNVVGADIYELLDQPDLGNSSEAQYGILDANGNPTDASAAVQAFLQSTPRKA